MTPGLNDLSDFLPILIALEMTTNAMREVFGRLYYWFKG